MGKIVVPFEVTYLLYVAGRKIDCYGLDKASARI
jgi:hypothetical protein